MTTLEDYYTDIYVKMDKYEQMFANGVRHFMADDKMVYLCYICCQPIGEGMKAVATKDYASHSECEKIEFFKLTKPIGRAVGDN